MSEKREPLTLDRLREMDGKPVLLVFDFELEPMIALIEYSQAADCIILTNNLGGRSEFYSDDELRESGIKAYSYPPAYIDRGAWEPCELCNMIDEPDPCYKDRCFRKNAPQCDYRCSKFLKWRSAQRRLRNAKFCPKCGRPLTDAAWDMLEKRLER